MARTTELLALLAGLHFLALVLIFQSTRIAVPFLEEFGIATGLSTTENTANSSNECWIEWDKQRKVLMEVWFEHDVPVMTTAVHGKRNKKGGVTPNVYVLFTQFHLSDKIRPKEWMCLYKDNENNTSIERNAKIAPLHRMDAEILSFLVTLIACMPCME